MREKDLYVFMHFILRTGMYTNSVSEHTIVSFVNGYELGSQEECQLSTILSEILKEKYQIQYLNRGWPGQISDYSAQTNQTWENGFKDILMKYFYDSQEFDPTRTFVKTLKQVIESRIKQTDQSWFLERFESWIKEWNLIISFDEKKFICLWSDDELDIIKKIDKNIKTIDRSNPSVYDNLLQLRTKYLRIKKG